MSSEVSSRRLVAATMLLALAFTSLTQTGCTRPVRRLGILDELAIQYRDRVWAQRAYNLRFANCNRDYESHFRSGFCAGYADVSNGGDGYLPALPPENYRGFEYQSADGAKCVESWFDGYPEGVAAARQEQAGSFHEMHVSRMIDRAVTQSNASNILPSDVPINRSSSKLLPPKNYGSKLGVQTPPALPTIAAVPKKAEKPASAKPVSPVAKTELAKPVFLQPQLPQTVSVRVTEKQVAKPSVLAPVKSITVAAPKKRKPLPPVISPTAKKLVPVVKAKAAAKPKTKVKPVSAIEPALPPIVRVKPMASKSSTLPPIVQGSNIDPAANVSNNEMPLPLTIKPSPAPRSASWPVNRK